MVVDDSASKGSKRKNPEETTRISIPVPRKGEDAPTEGDETGRSILQGGSTQNLTAGDAAVAQESTEVVAENLQIPRPVCCKKSKKSKASPPS
ncbi:hypothetical protein A2U01_0078120, partial [Trifolium medium]|nr:hypothetical protein [Trifolium medium]